MVSRRDFIDGTAGVAVTGALPTEQPAALYDFAGLQAPALFDAVVTVLLTVLLPQVASQKHSPVQNAMLSDACIEGRSALQATTKMFY